MLANHWFHQTGVKITLGLGGFEPEQPAKAADEFAVREEIVDDLSEYPVCLNVDIIELLSVAGLEIAIIVGLGDLTGELDIDIWRRRISVQYVYYEFVVRRAVTIRGRGFGDLRNGCLGQLCN